MTEFTFISYKSAEHNLFIIIFAITEHPIFMAPIKLPYATIYYEEPIVIFSYYPGTYLGVPELKKIVAIAENLSGGKPYVTYSDVRYSVNITDPGKKFLANPKNMPLFRGSAILVSTTLYSFAVNFVSGFNKKTYPIKAFVTEEKASEWLRSLPLNAKLPARKSS